MNTLKKKRAKDTIDILIFEKGLRIKTLMIDKDLDLLAVVLNNGKILESRISYYSRLEKASVKQLNAWRLISNGVGVSWENLDEDLSIKGFIKITALNDMLRHMLGESDTKAVV